VGAPVVLVLPVAHQLAHVVQVNAVGPPSALLGRIEPAGAGQPLTEVVQVCLRDRNAEEANCGVGEPSLGAGRRVSRGSHLQLVMLGHVEAPLWSSK
jgi:hypothetical protein